ncbi:MAG: S1/P1 nuclease [Bryobacteraceae bacterium]
MRLHRVVCVVLLPLIALPPAGCWGEVGHNVSGRIAARLLNARARRAATRILGAKDLDAAMGEAAYWADAVARKLYPQANPWHYINISLTDGPLGERPDPFLRSGTVYTKLVDLARRLREGRADEFEPASDLKFLIHFAGDLQQPLHAASNQDMGGNCVDVAGFRNLHSAWDTGLLEARLGRDKPAIAARLLARYRRLPAAEKARLEGRAIRGDDELVRQWVIESNALAVKHVYEPLRPPVPKFAPRLIDNCKDEPESMRGLAWTLDPAYIDAAGALIEDRLIAAGVRIAALLNRVLR